MLDTVAVPFYVDTNLVNGQTYCYRVTTLGAYDDPSTEHPLINVSQVGCAQPSISRHHATWRLKWLPIARIVEIR